MTDITTALEAFKVYLNDDVWAWRFTYCCDACFQSQGHGDEHRDGCLHVEMSTIEAELTRLREERDDFERIAELREKEVMRLREKYDIKKEVS